MLGIKRKKRKRHKLEPTCSTVSTRMMPDIISDGDVDGENMQMVPGTGSSWFPAFSSAHFPKTTRPRLSTMPTRKGALPTP